jgi:hypothetical protein
MGLLCHLFKLTLNCGVNSLVWYLLASCNVVHPDDGSGVIVKVLWTRLKHGD